MQTSAADGWEGELERWLAPFLAALNREAQAPLGAPVYLKGPLLSGFGVVGQRVRIEALGD